MQATVLPKEEMLDVIMQNESSSSRSIKNLSFAGDIGMINRMKARYRLVCEIDRIEYISYSADVGEAYTSLIKAFLTYSVFEKYMHCLFGETITKRRKKTDLEQGQNMKEATSNYFGDKLKISSSEMGSTSSIKQFFAFIYDELDGFKKKQDLEDCLNSNEYDCIVLLEAVRHVFVHGKLTASANASYPRINSKVLDTLSNKVLSLIADDFESKMSKQEENHKKRREATEKIKQLS